jgi:hypothetical protein
VNEKDAVWLAKAFMNDWWNFKFVLFGRTQELEIQKRKEKF